MGQLADKLVELFSVVKHFPADEWYCDGDRLMVVVGGRAHQAVMDSGSDIKEFEVLTRSPNGEDGRGAHGDGDKGTVIKIAALLNILSALKPLLNTPALSILMCVLAERDRQQAALPVGEGWSETHDDGHGAGELAAAAAYYAMAASGHASFVTTGRPPVLEIAVGKGFKQLTFPWEVQWFKPKSQQRNIEIAMALLVAHSETVARARRRKVAEAMPDGPFEELVRITRLRSCGAGLEIAQRETVA